MAKQTLLQIVQKLLVSINGDEVSSITDTVEAMSIANIVEDVYFNIVTNTSIPEHNTLLQIEGLSDSDFPNYLQLPSTTISIESFKYDKSLDTSTDVDYRTIKFVNQETFLKRVLGRNQADSNISVVTDFSGVKLLIQTDKFPEFWTSFDDYRMVFDSYDNGEESTLQASKTLAFGKTSPVFTLSDAFTPDLDENLFPLLLNESKSWVHLELRQQPHQKAEQQSRQQKVKFQNDKERFTKKGLYIGYGRK